MRRSLSLGLCGVYLLWAPQAWTQRRSRGLWQTGRRHGTAARPGPDRAPWRPSVRLQRRPLDVLSVLSYCACYPPAAQNPSSLRLRDSLIFKRWRQFKVNWPSWLTSLTFGLGLVQHFVNTAVIMKVLSAWWSSCLSVVVFFVTNYQERSNMREKREMFDTFLMIPGLSALLCSFIICPNDHAVMVFEKHSK